MGDYPSYTVSGDTGLRSEYAAIHERLGPFDFVMLEVGTFHLAWDHIHLGPENALEALELLGAGAFLPVHWGTFSLAMHAWDETAKTLLALDPKKGAQLVMPRLGEPVEPAHAERVTPWWRTVDMPRPGKATAEPQVLSLPESVPWPPD